MYSRGSVIKGWCDNGSPLSCIGAPSIIGARELPSFTRGLHHRFVVVVGFTLKIVPISLYPPVHSYAFSDATLDAVDSRSQVNLLYKGTLKYTGPEGSASK
ncbi:unnamed protein product [Ectocarpus sp. 13 AM-2016]